MSTSLKSILKCPKCRNQYGLIANNWKLGKDVVVGQTFICGECHSHGKLQEDNTISLTIEGVGIITKYGDDGEMMSSNSSGNVSFDDFDFSDL